MEQEFDPKVMEKVIERFRSALAKTLNEEIGHLLIEGADLNTCFNGALYALTAGAAYYACKLISPESDDEESRERFDRLQDQFIDTFVQIMETERRKVRG